MELDRTEARVLGALVEKRWTTPDQYPLSMNALIAACNQKSNRDPVMDLQEFEISGCLLGMRPKGLAIVHDQHGGRVLRYGEKLMEELGVSRQEIAILAELLLRGDQTGGELFRRCSRMAQLENQGRVDALLRGLAERRFVRLQPRETGQRYARWTQLLCRDRVGADDDGDEEGGDAGHGGPSAAAPMQAPAQHVPHHAPHASSALRAERGASDVPGPGRVAPPSVAPRPVATSGMLGAVKIHEPDVTAADIDALREELTTLRNEVATLRERVQTLEELV